VFTYKASQGICFGSVADRIENFKKCNEISFIAQVMKIKLMQSNSKSIPDGVAQVILLSSHGDIICLQIHDPHFFIKQSFPSEDAIIMCDSMHLDTLFVVVKTTGQHKKVPEQDFLCIDRIYPEGQFYIMCKTSNNSNCETASGRLHSNIPACIREQVSNQYQEMLAFTKSGEAYNNKVKMIGEIIGERMKESLPEDVEPQFTASANPNMAMFNNPQGSCESSLLVSKGQITELSEKGSFTKQAPGVGALARKGFPALLKRIKTSKLGGGLAAAIAKTGSAKKADLKRDDDFNKCGFASDKSISEKDPSEDHHQLLSRHDSYSSHHSRMLIPTPRTRRFSEESVVDEVAPELEQEHEVISE